MIRPGTNEAQDDVLARRIMERGGDAEAEAELCRRLAPRLRAYGRRHLEGDAATADLVQDVLVIVLERLRAGTVDAPENLASFALGACRRVASDRRRGEQRRRELLAAHASIVGEVLAHPATDLERLAGCLDKLPLRERTVIVASYFADEPAEATARALATSAGNVRVLRHRALRALHACLEAPP